MTQTFEHRKLVVIGSGPAGLVAATYAARADRHPLVYSGMVLYGQSSLTYVIENFPGFPDGIGGTELGQLFEKQAQKFGAQIELDQVKAIDLSKRPFEISAYSSSVTADAIILAMGADAKKLGVPGEIKFTGRGVSYCATCDGWFYKDKDIHVIGGGDSALEEGLFLTRFARSVTIIHRRDSLRAGAILENRARKHPKIKFIWDSVATECLGEDSLTGLRVKNVKTGQEQLFPSDGVFIFVGYTPNTGMLKGQLDLDEAGYVRVNHLMETSVPGVFAAGEIADPHFRQVITSAGMGAAAAIQADRYLDELENTA